jgi:glycine/D-amino acid oxidase-like deaminating enzyme
MRPGTWYEATGIAPPETDPAASVAGRFDVAVIGAGLAGLTLALTLAEAGARVLCLEAGWVGAGASGRNGGFCSAGWAADAAQVIRVAGPRAAARLEELAEAGRDWMAARAFADAHAQARAGLLTLSLGPDAGLPLGPEAVAAQVRGPRYRAGREDPLGFHFHPLNLLRRLAAAVREAGVTLVEGCAALPRRAGAGAGWEIAGAGLPGPVAAREVVLATGGYGLAALPRLRRILLPIRTFIAVTAPAEAIIAAHVPTRHAVSDTRRAGNYFRRLPDGRLLWGMGISAFGTDRAGRIAEMAQADIAAHLPGLAADLREAGAGIDFAWSGVMGYARHFLPHVRLGRDGLHLLAGFGGHGMNTAPAAALALAAAMGGDGDAVAPFAAVPAPPVFGALGLLAAEASYRWRQAEDAQAERRAAHGR